MMDELIKLLTSSKRNYKIFKDDNSYEFGFTDDSKKICSSILF